MRRLLLVLIALPTLLLAADPAGACAGLIGPSGTVELLRTSTLAAHADGVEHYVTSFEFAGGGAELGSLVPLPGVPTEVEKGGDWTLQRLAQEVSPAEADVALAASDGRTAGAEVLLEERIDALDITVLRGGGDAVGEWATENGFRLTPDAPEVLDFYAERSPVFMAARFDATAARERGQGVGQGTPVHLTIPTDEPWVPLRILGLGREPVEEVEADVFLLTEDRPSLRAGGPGLELQRREPASDLLLDDLRSDKGMGWVPEDMWFSHLTLDAGAEELDYDLAVSTTPGVAPSLAAAGVPEPEAVPVDDDDGGVPWVPVAAVTGVVVVAATAAVGWRGRSRRVVA